jgi:PDZ domain
MLKKLYLGTVTLTAIVLLVSCAKPNDVSNNQVRNTATAKAWITANNTSKAAAIAMVTGNMADEGVRTGNRFVGFGFVWDRARGNADGRMVVTEVTDGSPATATLKVGDEFLSVRGVAVNKESLNKLNFRGKPGEAVAAVIRRDGKEMPIEVIRGKVTSAVPKSLLLERFNRSNDDDWGSDTLNIKETIAEGNVVYVRFETIDVDQDVGLPYEEESVVRFVFNQDGKVTEVWGLSEDRYVLEQTGYTISR